MRKLILEAFELYMEKLQGTLLRQVLLPNVAEVQHISNDVDEYDLSKYILK